MYGLFLTITANAPQPEAVVRGPEPEMVCHLILQSLDLGRVELDHTAAVSADHVVVMLMVIVMFVIGLVVAKTDLTGKARVGQQLERSIDRSLTDVWIQPLDQLIKVFAGQMLLGTQKRLEDKIALGGTTKTGALQMLEKHFLFLCKLFVAPGHKTSEPIF